MKHLRTERGDTLVEVIFSVIILTSILVSTFTLGRLTRAQSSNADTRTEAINMMQEQYEALRSYRDRVGWANFVGANNPPNSIGIARRNDTPAYCNPASNCFHMERQSNSGLADYGQWVPCPGQWFPPLDYDSGGASGWSAAPTNPSDPYIVAYFTHYGCQGNTRTVNNQPIIQVGIRMDVPNAAHGCSYYPFLVSGNWSTAGTRGGTAGAQAQSLIYSYIANVRGDPFGAGTTCP